MAAPTAPTLNDLAAEALAKANIATTQANYASFLSRATGRWMEEVKNDIWQTVGASYNRRLKSLQSTSYTIGIVGQSQYALPADFEDILDVNILDTTRVDRSTALSVAAITGASSVTVPSDISANVGVGDKAVIRLDSGADQTVTVAAPITATSFAFSPTLAGGAAIGNTITFKYALTAATASTVTFSAGELGSESDLVGKHILMMSGGGAGQLAQIISYNPVSRVATMSASFLTTPSAGDTYIVADKQVLITEFSEAELDFITNTSSTGMPRQFTDYQGALAFDRPFDRQYGIRARYFANIHKLDLAGSVILAIYQNWQEVLIQGLYAKLLQNLDDNAKTAQFQLYEKMLQDLIARENPWVEGTDQISVDPWLTPFRGLAASSLSIGRY